MDYFAKDDHIRDANMTELIEEGNPPRVLSSTRKKTPGPTFVFVHVVAHSGLVVREAHQVELRAL